MKPWVALPGSHKLSRLTSASADFRSPDAIQPTALRSNSGSGPCGPNWRGPELATGDWHLTFTNELLRKDFDLGLAAARKLEVPMPATSTTYQLIQSAIGNGLRDEDFLSLYELQARSAGLSEPVT